MRLSTKIVGCLAAVVLYALNRWAFDFPALRGWFNDLLLVPAAAPWFLWLERRTGLRQHDGFPTLGELAFLLVAWSIAAEFLAPKLFAHCTGDPFDIAAYAAGAIPSALWWGINKT